MTTILANTGIVLFLIFWIGFGVWLLFRFEQLFGHHPDDPAETSGARALNQTQVWSCWIGMFVIMAYLLFT